MDIILRTVLIVFLLTNSLDSVSQYTLTTGPVLKKSPQTGGLDLKNTVYGKTDSLYILGLEKKNEQFTTHSIFDINELGEIRETRLLLEGNNDLELPFYFKGESWAVMYESILKKTTISRLSNGVKEVVYTYHSLKLKNKEKRFVLLDDINETAYLFYGNHERNYMVHAFDLKNRESKWISNINRYKGKYFGDRSYHSNEQSILLYSFINNEHIFLLEATKKDDKADIVLSRINKENGQVIDAIKVNPETSKYSLDIVRYIASTNKLYVAGRTYFGKKVKHKKSGRLFCLEYDLSDLTKQFMFLADELNEEKTIWQDVIVSGETIALLGETFESYTNTGEALALGTATAILTGGRSSITIWTDQFITKDVVFAAIDFSKDSTTAITKISLKETTRRMPDLQPYDVGLVAREEGLFRYKGQTSNSAIFFTEGYLHSINLNSFEVNSTSIEEKKILNFHIDFTRPLILPEDGLLLFDNSLNLEYFNYSIQRSN